MTLWNTLRSTCISALHHPGLWVVQFLGNLAIGFGFALWLQVDDRYWWQELFQLVLAILLLVAALVLHGGTLNYVSGTNEDRASGLVPAFKKAFKHLPAFAICVSFVYLALYFVAKLDNYQYEIPGYLRSEFPAWLRRLISEPAMDKLYVAFVAFLRWILVPGLFLPLGLLCARIGFHGFVRLGAWWRTIRTLAYWIVLILASIIAVYCTGKIMDWRLHPQGPAVTREEIWLGFRLLLVYLMALFSWLWACSMLACSQLRPDPPEKSQKIAA